MKAAEVFAEACQQLGVHNCIYECKRKGNLPEIKATTLALARLARRIYESSPDLR